MPTVAVGMKGIDFAFAPDDYPGFARNGAGFVSRYSAGVGGAGNGKCTRDGEIAQAVANNVDFIGNFELSETTPEEGGQSGIHHGAADKDFWNVRGYAPAAGVIISHEPGNDPAKFAAVADFITNYRAAIGRPVGLYAGLSELLWMRQRSLIDFTWLPMSSSASGYNWGGISQTQYAANMLKLAQDNGLNMVQNRNRWYGSGADEDIMVNMPGVPFSHMQAIGRPAPPAPPSPVNKMYQNAPVPGIIAKGTRQYFGNINGPAASHGGYYPAEQVFVQMIQRRLIMCGFVPGETNPMSGWADGIFDTKGNGKLTGPTTDAVVRFQRACMPGTQYYGQIWYDDWARLFSL